MYEELLLAYLKANCAGRSNTRKSVIIERALNMNGNVLRHHVNRMRRKGIPIGSCKEGYFYAVTAGEVYYTIRQLRVMEKGLNAAICGLEMALESFGVEEG